MCHLHWWSSVLIHTGKYDLSLTHHRIDVKNLPGNKPGQHVIRRTLLQIFALIHLVDSAPRLVGFFHLAYANSRYIGPRLDHPWARHSIHELVHFFRIQKWHKLRHINPTTLAAYCHRTLVAADLRPGATQPWHAQVFTHQCGRNYVKLFESDDPIGLGLPREKRHQVDEKRRPSIVWDRDQIIQTVSRPILVKHLLLGDQDHSITVCLAFANEIGTFEVGS